jgi:hypothetical protein
MGEITPVEEWRPIPGYERTYEVSNLGRVRSLRRATTSGGIRKLRVNRHGYIDVNLSQANRTRTFTVHALVMLAFDGPRPEGYEIRHLNGVQDDNRRVNLSYGTASANRLDITRHGNNRNANKTHCAHGHEFTPANTLVIPSRPRGRYCRTCRAGYNEARRKT